LQPSTNPGRTQDQPRTDPGSTHNEPRNTSFGPLFFRLSAKPRGKCCGHKRAQRAQKSGESASRLPSFASFVPCRGCIRRLSHLSSFDIPSTGCHYGSRIALLAAGICRDAPRPRVFPPVGRIAGRRRKSNVYNSLRRISSRVLSGPPHEGIGAHLAAGHALPPAISDFVNTSTQETATIVPIARIPSAPQLSALKVERPSLVTNSAEQRRKNLHRGRSCLRDHFTPPASRRALSSMPRSSVLHRKGRARRPRWHKDRAPRGRPGPRR
jgi:hypothetical protein